METTGRAFSDPIKNTAYNRRGFVETSLKMVATAGITGSGLFSACKEKEGEGQEVSPPEDLMQEHGLLNRVLLIYDTCKAQLVNKLPFQKEALFDAATVIRTFVEDYHEKQEENYLFPRFEKANVLTELVHVLRRQHLAGRVVTDKIIQLTKTQDFSESETQNLIVWMTAFNSMYRPHESREDTVLFPAFRKIVSPHEYDSLGKEFEKNEHTLFGQDGFETMVERVAGIEKSLGIYDLAQFTPKVE